MIEATVTALCLGTVANAAIIEYRYASPELTVGYYHKNIGTHQRPIIKDVTKNPAEWGRVSDSFGYSLTIDTDRIASKTISYEYSWDLPIGVIHGDTYIISEVRIVLDDKRNVSEFKSIWMEATTAATEPAGLTRPSTKADGAANMTAGHSRPINPERGPGSSMGCRRVAP